MAELDQLLTEWGRSRRLPDQVSDRIRTAILAEPSTTLPVLSAAWWRTVQPPTNPARAGLRAGNRVLAKIAA
ncbi:hypothetical protein [Microlunatus parietis]|uniref:Uncharacterized protein n=1 Tax=Microlunatus parietis TaxID=682979 RepID=A0A7Y9IAT8_9ACTN|nr:hypothetical protein [Microlunatus parietis]NYE73161.1 hypothetical protein [Microlunatus parietis]